MRRPTRTRVAVAILVGLVVFLLGSLVHEVQDRDRKIDRLSASNETVVSTLADVLTRVIAAEEAAKAAGKAPAVTVDDVLAKIRGLDQGIVDEALRRAQKAAKGPPGPPGPPGRQGAAGPPGEPAVAPTTTTTSPATTTTTHPAPTTTSTRSSPSNTTTTRCAVAIGPVLRLGCA